MHRAALAKYLADFLKTGEYTDYGPNGLQVEGRAEIKRLVTGVSASVELFGRAIEAKADAVLVHHGIIWTGQHPLYRGGYRERVRLLLAHEINLFAYHLPLDAHPTVGNNAQLGMLLELQDVRPFGEYQGRPIGVRGELDDVPGHVFFARVERVVDRKPLIFAYGPEKIRTVGIISGGAQGDVTQAVDEGLDVYITGEVSERTLHYAKEERIHFVSAGHYATKRFGVRALGNHLEERFGLEVRFVDLFNPV